MASGNNGRRVALPGASVPTEVPDFPIDNGGVKPGETPGFPIDDGGVKPTLPELPTDGPPMKKPWWLNATRGY